MSVFSGSNEFSQNIKAVQASAEAKAALDIDNTSNDNFGQEESSTRDKMGKRIRRVSFVIVGGGEDEIWTDSNGVTRSMEEASWEDDEVQASEVERTTTQEETMKTVSDEEVGGQEGVVGDSEASRDQNGS